MLGQVWTRLLGMKRTPRARVSTAKHGKAKTVDEYLAGLSQPARNKLEKLRLVIRSVMPKGATEVISYGIPAFRQKKIIVWYAAFSDHCSLFPAAAVIERFKDELKAYKISKGTIQFELEKPLPVGLIRRIVKARVADVEG